MIKGISSTGRYVMVSGGTPSTPYISPGAIGAGMLRWNANMNCMEVCDGNNWKMIDMGFTSIGLTGEAESLLDWAREQRDKQRAYENMANEHPAVRKALDALKRAEEQVDLVYKLSKEEYENEGVTTSP